MDRSCNPWIGRHAKLQSGTVGSQGVPSGPFTPPLASQRVDRLARREQPLHSAGQRRTRVACAKPRGAGNWGSRTAFDGPTGALRSRPLFAFVGIWRIWTGERKDETRSRITAVAHFAFSLATSENTCRLRSTISLEAVRQMRKWVGTSIVLPGITNTSRSARAFQNPSGSLLGHLQNK
jgi:hypothetical protein